MATKTAAKKKTTTARKSTASRSAKKTNMKELPISIFEERNPESHKVSGKFTFFYVLFACTTVIFAALSVRFFMISSDLLNKYQSIEVCARNGNCEVRVNGDTSDVTPVEEAATEE